MAKKYTQHSQYFSVSDLEMSILDPFKYRGKGRPRNKDYSPLPTVLRKLNTSQLQYLNKQMQSALYGGTPPPDQSGSPSREARIPAL